jgi:hypothetical protein
MKKFIVMIIITAVFSIGIYANDYNVFFGIGYGQGLSEFFEENTVNYTFDGNTFVETRKSNLGFSFILNMNIPLTEKLSIVPGISLTAGNQEYLYKELNADNQSKSNIKDSFHYRLFSGELLFSYDIIKLEKDIIMNILGGISYNSFSADEGMRIDDTNYFGAIMGLGIKFVQSDQFDLATSFTYNYAFNKEMPMFLRGTVGLRYKF